MGATGVLNFGGTSISPTLAASTAGNAVNYTGEQLNLQAFRYTNSRGLTDFYNGAGAAVAPRLLCPPIADYEQVHGWALDLVSVGDDPPRGFAAAQAIVDYLRPILAERAAAPRADLLSRLVHAEVDGNRLTEEEVLSFLRLLLPAGAETIHHVERLAQQGIASSVASESTIRTASKRFWSRTHPLRVTLDRTLYARSSRT